MALSLNKYNSILDSVNKEEEISIKDHEKTSTKTSIHLSIFFHPLIHRKCIMIFLY